MKKHWNHFWGIFFMFWPVVAILSCVVAPARKWWFPGVAMSPLGERIDDLFYLLLIIVTAVFIATQIAMGYVLWKGASRTSGTAWYTHGSHKLEVIWTIVPSGILLFMALYQLDVWAEFRVTSTFPAQARNQPLAEVTARQFEWRIRYPAPDRVFRGHDDIKRWLQQPEAGDLYTVNDFHIPTGRPVMFFLRSQDVQHAFFCPELRVKQDAVPGLVIPIWTEAIAGGDYSLLCAELCGWGHYKMKARLAAQPEAAFQKYLRDLQTSQNDDGYVPPSDSSEQE